MRNSISNPLTEGGQTHLLKKPHRVDMRTTMLKRKEKADLESFVYLLEMPLKVEYNDTKYLSNLLQFLESFEKNKRKRPKKIPW
jgi:hypothetical protein